MEVDAVLPVILQPLIRFLERRLRGSELAAIRDLNALVDLYHA